jgi:hypothetical protein
LTVEYTPQFTLLDINIQIAESDIKHEQNSFDYWCFKWNW